MKAITEILNKKVSVFPDANIVNRCITTTVGEWLNGCKNPKNKNLMPLVEQIRQTTDKKEKSVLKLKLPGVTMAAELTTRAKNVPLEKKIIERSGLLCFDIDDQDNPGLKPIEIREKLSLCTNVIFAALSVSGKGVWGLVEMQYPEKIKQHFEQLKIDFQALGIKLDTSKGGNPTDLRFYSYDPDAYFCEQYKNYDRLPQPKPQPKQPKYKTTTNGSDPIKIAIDKINSAPDGEKHRELLKAAKLLGGYVGSGSISYQEAETALFAAISSRDIQSTTTAQHTIRDGLNYGMNEPIYPEIKEFKPPVKKLDPLLEYFKNLNVDSFQDTIVVDGLPLKDCIDTWIKEGDRLSLQALQIELKKQPTIPGLSLSAPNSPFGGAVFINNKIL
ncbi:MAG: hypothetical protein A2W85_06320 [Bacteroidetes bacterium GWF2_41_31]|nr:MAG: hypothetical protein A2W85_06320 [Bacteroidetes bacterium GWF2_41_31]